MQDLMIDLETLGTHVNAPIIAIGAVWFDPETGEKGPTYYRVLDVADQIDSKVRFADASTIKWWMQQANAAKEVFKDNAMPTQQVLEEFRQWIMGFAKASKGSKATRKCFPWGNGSGFDITLMETIFNDYNVECPWLYYNVMDLRTFKRFTAKGAKVEKLEGVNHNALDDAINQVDYVLKHLGHLK